MALSANSKPTMSLTQSGTGPTRIEAFHRSSSTELKPCAGAYGNADLIWSAFAARLFVVTGSR